MSRRLELAITPELAGVRVDTLLKKHMVSPVRFTSELAALQAGGYDTFIELGPNKVLSGLVKKTLKGVSIFNIENPSCVENVCKSI